MPSESGQDKKGRERPTRVHITYKVDTGKGIKNVEIPFVVGVMGDFKGNPKERRKSLKDPDRKFIEIAPDTFNKVMEGMSPRITPRVKNRLKNDGSELSLDLTFNSLEDLEPDNLAKKIGPLRELMDIREKLVSLLSKAGGKYRAEELLEQILDNAEARRQAKEALGLETPSAEDKQ